MPEIAVALIGGVVGLLYSSQYHLYAGGTGNMPIGALVVLTIAAGLLSLTLSKWGVARLEVRARNPKYLSPMRLYRAAFWIILAYSSLPVVMNQASIQFARLGYVGMSNFAFRYRFESLYWTPGLLFILAAVAAVILDRIVLKKALDPRMPSMPTS